MRVLVVEDHEGLADAVSSGLRQDGMAVDVALDGNTALERTAVTDYDVIVLDRDLPDVHGDEVCRTLVANRAPSRILMLTASATIADRVEGLGLGADDYLPKPFDAAELVARIRALARRAVPRVPPIFEHANLTLDPARRLAIRNGRRLALTSKEFGVLEYLLAAEGRIVSAEDLLAHVWDQNADPFTAAVKVTISRLRTKLGDPALIHTVRERGYYM